MWLLLQTKHVPGPLFWQPVIVAAFAVSSRREERNGIITASFSVVIVEETYAWISPGRIPNDPEHAVALARRAKGTSMLCNV